MAINYLHREKEAQALAEELALTGVPVMTVRPDVSDRGQVQTMVDNLLKEFCQLDILGCNSGVSEIGLVSDIDEERWHRIFGVNVDGVRCCCQAVLPRMIHRKAGSIVTLSSMWGQVGGSCETAYSATKGAVIAYTKALAKEVGPSGIRVNCVAPRVIGTEMNGRLSEKDTAALAERLRWDASARRRRLPVSLPFSRGGSVFPDRTGHHAQRWACHLMFASVIFDRMSGAMRCSLAILTVDNFGSREYNCQQSYSGLIK